MAGLRLTRARPQAVARRRSTGLYDYTDAEYLSFTATNGLTSRYHRYAGGLPDPQGSVGLLVQLHGDEAWEFRNPSSTYSLGGMWGITAHARYRNMICVPIETPDNTGSITWWESGAPNALVVRELIQKMYADYDIDLARVWVQGYSGGAQLTTKFLVPTHSDLFPSGGGFLAVGGGGPPTDEGGVINPFDPSFKAVYRACWYTGQADDGTGTVDGYDAYGDAQAGKSWYDTEGFSTAAEWPAGVTHDLDSRFGPILGRFLDAYDGPPFISGTAIRTSQTSARWSGTVLRAPAVTFRVSRNELISSNMGFYITLAPNIATGAITLDLTSLSAGITYNWQLEVNSEAPSQVHGQIKASGVLSA